MTLTLAATNTIRGVAGAATAITYTIFGDEVAAGGDEFKVLAQGQLPSSIGTLYTVPSGEIALIKAIHLANPTGTARTAQLNVNGTSGANVVLPPTTILAGGFATYDGRWTFYNDQGQALGVGATGATGAAGADGEGVPAGGTTGQRLAKVDGTDFNTEWVDPASAAITVEDEGTPLATAATTLDFVGAGVTASGTGAEKTITIPGGGSGITVEEVDGTPSGSVTKLILPNGTLSVVGSDATYTPDGGSGDGLPSGYHPDRAPSSPSATDDEFNDSSLHADWSWLGGTTPATVSESAYVGKLQVEWAASVTDYQLQRAYVPGASDLTVAAKLHPTIPVGNLGLTIGIVTYDSADTKIGSVVINPQAADPSFKGTRISRRNVDTLITTVDYVAGRPFAQPIYLALHRTAAGSWTASFSNDGLAWTPIGGATTNTATVAKVGLRINPAHAFVGQLFVDWIRMFSSITTKIGSA